MASESEPSSEHLAGVVQKNIDSLLEANKRYEHEKTLTDRIADAIARWSGSMLFVYLHVVFFTIWIGANINVMRLPAFDPYPFGLLTTIVSLEAIFLSTFVLVSQHRQAALADHRRSDLDLQINLLSERETTRMLQMRDAVAKHLQVQTPPVKDLEELEADVDPDAILGELDRKQGKPVA